MKTIFFPALILTGTLIFYSCGGSGTKEGENAATAEQSAAPVNETPAIRKYGVKSGIVTFEHSGFGMKTKTILYFDDYGTKEAEEKYDADGNMKETSLCDGKNRYILIHKDKTAFKQGECFRGVAYKFDWDEAARSGVEYKPAKLSNQNIAGKDCESFSLEISGSKTVYAGWNNVCFMIETPAGNEKIIYKAVSFEENASVPGDKLSLPGDYKLQ